MCANILPAMIKQIGKEKHEQEKKKKCYNKRKKILNNQISYRNRVIEKLAEEVYRHSQDECHSDKKCSKKNSGFCTGTKDEYITCIINWGEEQVKHGT